MPTTAKIKDATTKGKIAGTNMFIFEEPFSLIGRFYPKFQTDFGIGYQAYFNLPSIQISVIFSGGPFSTSPFLKIQ